jgi:pilus assembly protein CpaB
LVAGSDDDARRGRRLAVGLTLGSIAVAAVTAWSLFLLFDGSQSALDAIWQRRESLLTDVPAFAHPLGRGTVITDADLVQIRIPEAMVPDEALRESSLAVGRTLFEPVLAGDLLRRERFAKSPGSGLRAILPAGMRALALDLKPGAFVSGAVQPGNRVDVIVTLPEDDGTPAQTETVLRDVRVLAVDEWMSETAMGEEILRSQVTLAVQPGEGLRVTHAAALAKGGVRLSLIGELEGLAGAVATAGPRRLGREDERLDVAAFREQVSDAEVDAMYRRYFGTDRVQEPIVDPVLVRGLATPPAPR